jgi:serine/threonine protein kinase
LKLIFDLPRCEFTVLNLVQKRAISTKPQAAAWQPHSDHHVLPRAKLPTAKNSNFYPELHLTAFIGCGSVGNVFKGFYINAQAHEVVGKVAEDKTSQELLHHEAQIYAVLSAPQTFGIPQVYGLFVGPSLHVLVTEYEHIFSFSHLSHPQWQVSHSCYLAWSSTYIMLFSF